MESRADGNQRKPQRARRAWRGAARRQRQHAVERSGAKPLAAEFARRGCTNQPARRWERSESRRGRGPPGAAQLGASTQWTAAQRKPLGARPARRATASHGGASRSGPLRSGVLRRRATMSMRAQHRRDCHRFDARGAALPGSTGPAQRRRRVDGTGGVGSSVSRTGAHAVGHSMDVRWGPSLVGRRGPLSWRSENPARARSRHRDPARAAPPRLPPVR